MVSGADVWVEVWWVNTGAVGYRNWQRHERTPTPRRVSGPATEYFGGDKCGENCLGCTLIGERCNNHWPDIYRGDMEVYVW